MNVPEEIFELINTKNLNLYLTCKNFHHHIQVFYKKYILDVKKGYQKIGDYLYVNKVDEHAYNNARILINADQSRYMRYKHLTHILFDHHFNDTIDDLPDTIMHIILGRYFNLFISKLPKSLVSLTVTSYLRFPINVNVFPKSFRELNINNNLGTITYNFPMNTNI